MRERSRFLRADARSRRGSHRGFRRRTCRINRSDSLSHISHTLFDIVVIGGGITGATIARDAAMRGLAVALLEKNDFASGTSSKTSKLAHGGIRYLEQMAFGLVGESLRERSVLLRTAPHLVRPLPFLFPSYRGERRPRWLITLGGLLYNKLARERTVGDFAILSANNILARENILAEGLQGGILYTDAQMDDARVCLENILDAEARGAVVCNYVHASGFVKENGRITAIHLTDTQNHTHIMIRGKIIIVACGPWGDDLARIDNPTIRPLMRPTKGVHLVLATPLVQKHAVAITSRQDNRIMFAIPWRGGTLIGTTDTDYHDSLDHITTDSSDVDYLLREATRIFPNANLSPLDVVTTFAGLRPTIRQEGKAPSAISREHVIRETPGGLWQIAGGKFTTARAIAEEIVDRVLDKLKPSIRIRCRTAETPLPGAAGIDFADVSAHVDMLAKNLGHSHETIRALVQTYGSRFMTIVGIANKDPRLWEPVCPHTHHVLAEVIFAKQNEYAVTIEDILMRRLPLSHLACRGNEQSEKLQKILDGSF